MRHAYSANIHNNNPSTSYGKPEADERWIPLEREKSYSAAAVNNVSEEDISMKRVPSHTSLLKRALSMQFLAGLRQPKLEKELCDKIRLRYKDTSKFVIWPECPLPPEFNQGTIALRSTSSRPRPVNYKHAGNHQAEVMRHNNIQWDAEIRRKLREGKLDVSAFSNPNGIAEGRAKFYYQASPVLPPSLPPIEEVRFRKATESVSYHVAHLDNEKTPMPRRLINEIRRSESSDDDESIIGLTASDQELEVEPHTIQL